jgi:amino-acid N-acetyltransferase
MNLAPEPAAQDLISLLEECALPTADVSPSLPAQFFGVRSGKTLAAVVGLELYPPFGLLRSLAVAPSQRRWGHARALVKYAESFAASQGIETLFLLTTTADQFFLALGYSNAARGAAPLAIQATSQFASLCPASSSFLSRHVTAG